MDLRLKQVVYNSLLWKVTDAKSMSSKESLKTANFQDMYLVLKAVEVNNFGIHKHLTMSFEKPINLIVGANAVGKTTLLDAVSIALGGESDRYGTLKDLVGYVGPAGDKASVTVYLRNPSNENKNHPLVDYGIYTNYVKEELKIEVTITRDSVYWQVNDRQKKHGRQEIRKMLQSATIRIDMSDEILFTRKDTIDKFMSGSPVEQFQQILTSLKLANLQEDIQNTQGEVKNLQNKLPELDYRRKSLEKDLEVAKQLKEQYERKFDLLDQKARLTNILNWIEYNEWQTRLIELDEQTTLLKKDLEELQHEYQEIETQSKQNKRNEQLLQDQLNEMQTRLTDLTRQNEERLRNIGLIKEDIAGKEAEHRIKDQYLQENVQRQENLQKIYQEEIIKGSLLSLEDWKNSKPLIEEKRRALKDLQQKDIQALQTCNSRLSHLATRIKRYDTQENQILNELAKLNQTVTSGTKFNAGEHHVLALRRALDQLLWGKKVTKPLFQEIFIKPDGELWEGAINHALGGLRSYVLAKDAATINQLREYMEQNNFSVWVARLPKIANIPTRSLQSLPENLKDLIVGWIDDFLEFDDPFIATYLLARTRALLVKSNASATELLELAKITGADVYTAQPSVFKPDGRFRTNVRTSYSLGKRTDNIEKVIELQTKLEHIKNERAKLIDQRLKILEKKAELQDKQAQLQEQIDALQDQITHMAKKDPTSILKSIEELDKTIKEQHKEIERIAEELESTKTRLKPLTENTFIEEIKYLNNEIPKIQEQIGGYRTHDQVLENRLIELKSKIETMKAEYQDIERDLELRRSKVAQYKESLVDPAPKRLPPKTKVLREIYEIDGAVNQITATAYDVEQYEKLEKYYQETGQDIERVSQALDETRQQLEDYYQEWKQRVKFVLQQLQDVANFLLSPFIQVRCSTTNSLDMKQIGLKVEFTNKTNGNEKYELYHVASGGERALITQSLFLALHTLNRSSPIHIVDEFTQRLDEKYRGHAFIMVKRLLEKLKEINGQNGGYNWNLIPQLILVAPIVVGSYIPPEIDTQYLFKVTKLS